MAKTKDKIVLACLIVLLIAVNSLFITALASNSNINIGKVFPLIDNQDGDQGDESGDDNDESDSEDESENDSDEDGSISPEELSEIDGLITEEEAKEIALEHVGGGNVVEFEAERENGIIIYEVEIDTGSDDVEVRINAETGEVIQG